MAAIYGPAGKLCISTVPEVHQFCPEIMFASLFTNFPLKADNCRACGLPAGWMSALHCRSQVSGLNINIAAGYSDAALACHDFNFAVLDRSERQCELDANDDF